MYKIINTALREAVQALNRHKDLERFRFLSLSFFIAQAKTKNYKCYF
jgi:hypothetical protein